MGGDAVLVEAAVDGVFVIGMGSINPALKDRAGYLCPLAGAAADMANLP